MHDPGRCGFVAGSVDRADDAVRVEHDDAVCVDERQMHPVVRIHWYLGAKVVNLGGIRSNNNARHDDSCRANIFHTHARAAPWPATTIKATRRENPWIIAIIPEPTLILRSDPDFNTIVGCRRNVTGLPESVRIGFKTKAEGMWTGVTTVTQPPT